ncbi:hypothetical protein [Aquisphaera insulae]|uniref:hypothetical protein n=1 Tax=Aquisphaera insulae TaxID=2712864 RepID=UPI0013EC5ED6|nr:hypothetical protein [Aquisphaera insulae]
MPRNHADAEPGTPGGPERMIETMRCHDVIHSLSSPGPAANQPAVAQHLASCPACARRADEAAKLDRLWGATAPDRPDGDAWGRVWSAIDARLDAPAMAETTRPSRLRLAPATSAGASARRPRWMMAGAAILAVAAALLVAFVHEWQAASRTSDAPAIASSAGTNGVSPSIDPPIEIEEGQVALIWTDDREPRVVDMMSFDPLNDEDPWFYFLNRIEDSRSVVVMSE